MAVTLFPMDRPTPTYQSFLGGMQGVQDIQLNTAKQALMDAQAKRENAMARLPFGGASLPGVAGQIAGLESVKAIYGEQSPQYVTAKRLFDLNMQNDESRINYQNALTGSMPTRYLTPTGKSIEEQARSKAGLAPSGQQWSQISTVPGTSATGGAGQPQPAPGVAIQAPADAQTLSNQYDLLRQKNTTDGDARKRNLYASNIEKTIASIDPSALTQYAGAMGGLKKLANSAAAPFGKEDPNYDRYQQNKIATQMLATQIRQFYGDSVQPAVQEKLDKLTNPDFWNNNPKIAMQNYNQLVNILQKEMKTYRDALQSRDVYLGNESQPSIIPAGGQPLPLSNQQAAQNDQLHQQAGVNSALLAPKAATAKVSQDALTAELKRRGLL